MTSGIVVRGLARRYGAVTALAGIDLEVAPGEIVGLLGPNGAGKTTAIEAIAGLTRPDTGAVLIDGVDALADPAAARRATGVVLQRTGLPAKITPYEAVRAFAILHGTAIDPATLLDRFGLSDRAGATVDTLSGGQAQRLALALAFVGDPRAVLLDEPTTGLDPAMRRVVQDHVAALRDEGRAVLLATHDMAEAERLCDRIAVIDRGRIVATGTPAALVGGAARTITAEVDRALDWPAVLPGIGPVAGDGKTLRFAADDLNRALPALVAWLDTQRGALLALHAGPQSLEDFVLAVGQR